MSNVFMVIPEGKETKEKRPITFYSFDKEKLKEYNEKGYGVYKAVNSFSATKEEIEESVGTTARQICFLKKLNYVYADIDVAKKGDGQTQEEIEAKKERIILELGLHCMPSILINTRNGIQPLWKLDTDDISKETQKKFVNVVNGVIEWSKLHGSHGDKVKDVTRVVRMPGFYHMKSDPYMVNSENLSTDIFTLDELAEKFPYEGEEEKEYEPQKISHSSDAPEQFREIERLDIKDVAIKAFNAIGRSAEFDSKGRLILDGRLTGTFQGKDGDRQYLASTSHEPFEGNKITVVSDILQINKKDAYIWILDAFNISNESELKNKKTNKERSSNLITSQDKENTFEDKYFTWGNESVDKKFGMMSAGDLVVVASFTSQGKTLRCTQIARKNGMNGVKSAYLTLEVTPAKLKKRQGIMAAGLTKYEYQMKQYSQEDASLMEKVSNDFDKDFYLVGFKDLPHIDELVENIKDLYEEGYDLIFVDNLDKIKSDDINDVQRQGRITSALQNLKNNYPICIVLIHHYNKPKEGDMNKSGGLHKIRGTNKTGDDSNILIEIRRDNDIHCPTNQVRITQYKDTDLGTVGECVLYYVAGEYKDDPKFMVTYKPKKEDDEGDYF